MKSDTSGYVDFGADRTRGEERPARGEERPGRGHEERLMREAMGDVPVGACPLLCEPLGILKTGHNHVGIIKGKGSRHADLTAGLADRATLFDCKDDEHAG